ncbi:unnamed protein product [Knipowitschia caucasica]|uniref:Ig-like domain-containing protein n=1 Tax=Knipowitschia caucasica TaxID=637954 RepID=A0AAV2LYT7_KNICA
MWVPELLFFIYYSVSCSAQENALPVPSVHLQSQWSEVFPSELVTLNCDIQSEDWAIVWYRDEQEVPDSSVTLSEENKILNFNALSHSQSGQYSCKGRRKTNASVSTTRSNAVQITVQEQKLNPAITIDGNLRNIFVGESFKLRCSVREQSLWKYVWYRDGTIIHRSSEEEHIVGSAAVTDTGNYHCRIKRGGVTVSSDSNTISVQVTDVPTPTVKLLSPWSDVIMKEKVLLRCETLGPDWTFSWFKDGQAASSPNLKVTDQGGAQLTITAVSKSLQRKYTCRAQHNTRHVLSAQSQPVTITVHDTPKPTLSKTPALPRLYIGETVTFSCAVSLSGGWTFKWFRDDVEIGRSDPTLSITLGRSDAGGYSCKALRGTGGETHTSDKMTQAVSDVPTPTVKLLSPWSDVIMNEEVLLRCETLGPDWTFSWFKDGQAASSPNLKVTDQGGAQLTITAVSKSLQGKYTCRAQHNTRHVLSAQSQPVTITVHDTPKPTLSKTPALPSLYIGETVTFSCAVSLSGGWTFKWFRDDVEIGRSDPTLSITLGQSDAGGYSCKALRGTGGETHTSDKMTQAVSEVPVPQLKALTPWLDVFPSEAVVLGCEASSAPHDWTYEWMKDGQKMLSPSHHTLNINSASAADVGQYKCRAVLKGRRVTTSFSTGLALTVYTEKPQPLLVQSPDYSTLFPQEPLSLHCRITESSGWHFVWYKNNVQLPSTAEKYEVKSPDATHSGSYSCQARRGQIHSFSTDLSHEKKVEIRKDAPVPVLSQLPDVDTVYMGEIVIFYCKLNLSSDWEYHWYKHNQNIPVVSDSYSIIVNATHGQREVYKCKAKRKKTLFETESQEKHITISDIPIPSVKSLTQWLDVFPMETVKLHCGMETGASDWIYIWNRDGRTIAQNEQSTQRNQNGSVLTIVSSVSLAGQYCCMAKHRRRPVNSINSSAIRLQVYDEKPRVTLVQDPKEKTFYTDDPVSFSCGVNVSSGWEYSWYKNNVFLEFGPNHTIRHVHTSHSGDYKCLAGRGPFQTDHSQSAIIQVKERPSASVLLLTGWSEVFSTDSLVLQCEARDSEDKDWEFQWFKGDEKIEQPLSYEHTVTPQNDPDQSQYMCQGVRSGRPSYTKHSQPLKTTNLLLKRRVLLSISGCLVFGLFTVFLGCIVLRVFRKQVVDQEKPEEVDLFLTTAELSKHAPNPMAEYITDEDLTGIETKDDENGTVDCDTTLLPRASEENQATPSESNCATGNSEMVSFKH